MAPRTEAALLIVALAVSCAAVALAQPNPGDVFPYYDNCRRQQENQVRNVTALARQDLEDGNVQYCFRINVNNATGNSTCQPEIFQQKGVNITSRCCNTTFAKIKFYVNVDCKDQFLPSNLTVPLDPSFNKIVSPTWEYIDNSTLNYTAVKYTQFGPIPQSSVNNATFCLKLRPPTGEPGSTCNISTLAGITNPTIADQGLFQLAIYDRKTNNYECCPTFTYNATATQRRRVRRRRRVARKMLSKSWTTKLAEWAGWVV